MPTSFVLATSGGRHFSDYHVVHKALLHFLDCCRSTRKSPRLLHGGCRGADTLVGRFIQEHGIEHIVYVADWSTYGRSAGPRRNRTMLTTGSPNALLLFPGGAGTMSCKTIAVSLGIPVYNHHWVRVC